MSLKPVKSSNIKAVGYDPGTKDMTVQFHSGTTHRFHDVSAKVHAGMMKDGVSIGSYFHEHIRSAHKSTKLEED